MGVGGEEGVVNLEQVRFPINGKPMVLNMRPLTENFVCRT